MAFVKISQVAHYVPDQVVTNDDLAQILDTSQLATRVAEQLLTKSSLSAEELDVIIVATITPDSLMPSTAACSGFTFALATADKLISSGAYQRGLVIGAEVFSKTLDWSDRSTAVLFGDGAAGVLLEASDQHQLLAESLNTDGTACEPLQSGRSVFGSPFAGRQQAAQPALQMKSRTIFNFAIKTVA